MSGDSSLPVKAGFWNDGRSASCRERKPPKTRIMTQSDAVTYARRANWVTIRHPDGQVVAIIEIVSPGNKDSKHAVRTFARKAVEFLHAGIHLLIVDLFPPSSAIRRESTSSSGTASATNHSYCLGQAADAGCILGRYNHHGLYRASGGWRCPARLADLSHAGTIRPVPVGIDLSGILGRVPESPPQGPSTGAARVTFSGSSLSIRQGSP